MRSLLKVPVRGTAKRGSFLGGPFGFEKTVWVPLVRRSLGEGGRGTGAVLRRVLFPWTVVDTNAGDELPLILPCKFPPPEPGTCSAHGFGESVCATPLVVEEKPLVDHN